MNKKRKQIIDAAHQLFIDKGFGLTSIQDILDKAGVAKGTFYNYFNSKNECLLAILELVSEEVEQKRREISIGKENSDEEVFLEQFTVRVNTNRHYNLLVLFESVSFSKDHELKSYMKEQHRVELQWIAKRLREIYPPEARLFTLDHAVMLVGIIHQMMRVWKLGTNKEIDVKNIIRYALTRVKSMIDYQVQHEEAFLPLDWLGHASESGTVDVQTVIIQVEELQRKLKEDATSKQRDLIQFLLTELQEANPRSFLIESVILSLEHAFQDSKLEHDVQHIVKLAWKIL